MTSRHSQKNKTKIFHSRKKEQKFGSRKKNEGEFLTATGNNYEKKDGRFEEIFRVISFE